MGRTLPARDKDSSSGAIGHKYTPTRPQQQAAGYLLKPRWHRPNSLEAGAAPRSIMQPLPMHFIYDEPFRIFQIPVPEATAAAASQ